MITAATGSSTTPTYAADASKSQADPLKNPDFNRFVYNLVSVTNEKGKPEGPDKIIALDKSKYEKAGPAERQEMIAEALNRLNKGKIESKLASVPGLGKLVKAVSNLGSKAEILPEKVEFGNNIGLDELADKQKNGEVRFKRDSENKFIKNAKITEKGDGKRLSSDSGVSGMPDSNRSSVMGDEVDGRRSSVDSGNSSGSSNSNRSSISSLDGIAHQTNLKEKVEKAQGTNPAFKQDLNHILGKKPQPGEYGLKSVKHEEQISENVNQLRENKSEEKNRNIRNMFFSPNKSKQKSHTITITQIVPSTNQISVGSANDKELRRENGIPQQLSMSGELKQTHLRSKSTGEDEMHDNGSSKSIDNSKQKSGFAGIHRGGRKSSKPQARSVSIPNLPENLERASPVSTNKPLRSHSLPERLNILSKEEKSLTGRDSSTSQQANREFNNGILKRPTTPPPPLPKRNVTQNLDESLPPPPPLSGGNVAQNQDKPLPPPPPLSGGNVAQNQDEILPKPPKPPKPSIPPKPALSPKLTMDKVSVLSKSEFTPPPPPPPQVPALRVVADSSQQKSLLENVREGKGKLNHIEPMNRGVEKNGLEESLKKVIGEHVKNIEREVGPSKQEDTDSSWEE